MGVLKQAILVAMLAVTVFSEKLSYTPTEYPPTTTMEGKQFVSCWIVDAGNHGATVFWQIYLICFK